jgi:hypothetical protein
VRVWGVLDTPPPRVHPHLQFDLPGRCPVHMAPRRAITTISNCILQIRNHQFTRGGSCGEAVGDCSSKCSRLGSVGLAQRVSQADAAAPAHGGYPPPPLLLPEQRWEIEVKLRLKGYS